MPYNFKEKKTHFTALRNPDAAVYDFELLRKKRPLLPQLKTYARDPKRYADDILYSLLDYTTRDEIRAFRRQMQEDKTSGNKSTADTATGTANSAPAGGLSETHSAEDTVDTATGTANSAPAEDVEELKQSLEEAEQRAEEAEEAQEEAEARAEEAEQALEAEKKKELPTAPVKSKSTRSTRKSTGTTSSTRKSK